MVYIAATWLTVCLLVFPFASILRCMHTNAHTFLSFRFWIHCCFCLPVFVVVFILDRRPLRLLVFLGRCHASDIVWNKHHSTHTHTHHKHYDHHHYHHYDQWKAVTKEKQQQKQCRGGLLIWLCVTDWLDGCDSHETPCACMGRTSAAVNNRKEASSYCSLLFLFAWLLSLFSWQTKFQHWNQNTFERCGKQTSWNAWKRIQKHLRKNKRLKDNSKK